MAYWIRARSGWIGGDVAKLVSLGLVAGLGVGLSVVDHTVAIGFVVGLVLVSLVRRGALS